MKVVFGDLSDMIDELKEKRVKELRVAALYDTRHTEQGIPMLRVYVNVNAWLGDGLYAQYQEVTFNDIKPAFEEERKSRFEEQHTKYVEMKCQLAGEGFTIRSGHFED